MCGAGQEAAIIADCNEKRIFCRVEIDAEVSYTIGREKTLYRGRCRNLSHSGIQFQSGKRLEEGLSLGITIDTKSRKFKPMNARVEVLRVEPLENGEYIVSGKILEYI